MAHFFSTVDKVKRKDRKEKFKDLTNIDWAILERAGKTGASYFSILHACRPYKSKTGIKFSATSNEVINHISLLKKSGLLEIR